MGLKHFINSWIVGKAISHLSKSKVVYKSSLHNRFREDGVKTFGRFDIMLSLMLVIHHNTKRHLGIRKIDLHEDNRCIFVYIELNKPSHLVIHKDDIEEELGEIMQKKVVLELKYTSKLFGLDYYNVF